MKEKSERLIYWLIGEDPILRSEHSKERASKQSGKKNQRGSNSSKFSKEQISRQINFHEMFQRFSETFAIYQFRST